MNWEVISLISGLFLAGAALIREMSVRRKTREEAKALDAKTPHEVDVLVATKEAQEYDRLVKFNEIVTRDNQVLREHNGKLDVKLSELDTTVQELVTAQRHSDRRTSRLEGWLTAAHQHIADFQRWGEKHAPGVKQPEPPSGYRPPTRAEEEYEDERENRTGSL